MRARRVIGVLSLAAFAVVLHAQWIEDTIAFRCNPYSVRFLPDDRMLYVTLPAESLLSIVDAERLVAVDSVALPAELAAIAVAPDLQKLYLYGGNNRCVLVSVDVRERRVLRTFTLPVRIDDVCYYEELRRLYVVSTDNYALYVYDCTTDELIEQVTFTRRPYRLCVSPVTGRLFVGCLDEWLIVYDCVSGRPSLYVGMPGDVCVARYCDIQDKAYFVAVGYYPSWWSTLCVVDCRTCEVLVQRLVGRNVWQSSGAYYDPLRDEMHVSSGEWSTDLIVDCASDSVVAEIPTPDCRIERYCLDAANDRMYYDVDGPDRIGALDCEQRSVLMQFTTSGSPLEMTWNPYLGRTYIPFSLDSIVLVLRDSVPPRSDASVRAISDLRGVLDSMTIKPHVVLMNRSSSDESVPAILRIGTASLPDTLWYYEDTICVRMHPFETKLIRFGPWDPIAPGPHVAECFSLLPGDECPGNDTARSSFLVTWRYRDARAYALLCPRGTVDSGASVTPKALIMNYGEHPELIPVRLSIGNSYVGYDTLLLYPRSIDTARFDTWTAERLGWFAVVCSTMLAGDSMPANDRWRDSVHVVTPHGVQDSTGQSLQVLALVPSSPSRLPVTLTVLARPNTGVEVSIHTADGRAIRTFALGTATAETRQIVWNGADESGRRVGTGVYYCRASSGRSCRSVKLVLTE